VLVKRAGEGGTEITGATGSLSRWFQKHLENTPGKNSSVELILKTDILGTAHIFRKILTSHFIKLECIFQKP
jgi:hypothetical protein